MKLKLAREEGKPWMAYKLDEKLPDVCEQFDVDTDELFTDLKDWQTVRFCEAVLQKSYRHVITSNDQDLSDVAYNQGNRTYAWQVNSDAESIREDILSGDIVDRDDLDERIYQEAENATMYTRNAYEIILYSDNADSGLDEGVVVYDRKHCAGDTFIGAMAYWAYAADLRAALAQFDDIDLNDDNLGRCSECDGKGYTVNKYSVLRRCMECEKYSTHEDAVDAGVKNKDVNRCYSCGNLGYSTNNEEENVEACTRCTSMTDENAQEQADEDA